MVVAVKDHVLCYVIQKVFCLGFALRFVLLSLLAKMGCLSCAVAIPATHVTLFADGQM